MNWKVPDGTAALIFDCDGTLANTMPLHYRAWTAVLSPLGIAFSETRFYQLGGMPTYRIINLLSEESGIKVDNVEALVREKEQRFLQELPTVEAIPAVARVALQHKESLPMAVASGGYRSVVSQTLQSIGILHHFQALVCAEDVTRHKPEPDVFLEAARRLGVKARNCVAFEDTDIGLEAIRRAGMTGIDVRLWYGMP